MPYAARACISESSPIVRVGVARSVARQREISEPLAYSTQSEVRIVMALTARWPGVRTSDNFGRAQKSTGPFLYVGNLRQEAGGQETEAGNDPTVSLIVDSSVVNVPHYAARIDE